MILNKADKNKIQLTINLATVSMLSDYNVIHACIVVNTPMFCGCAYLESIYLYFSITNFWLLHKLQRRHYLPIERTPLTCLTSLNSPTTVFSASFLCFSFIGADLPPITSATWATNP